MPPKVLFDLNNNNGLLAVTEGTINQAAHSYAREILGEEQYFKNKDAVLAITETFKDGIIWLNAFLKKQQEDKN